MKSLGAIARVTSKDMKKILLVIITAIVSSCASFQSDDPDSLLFNIPKGSTLSLNKKLTIPHSDTHVVVQGGKEIADRNKNEYAINCRLDLKEFGPRTIEPETFAITRTEDGQNWISHPSILRFYTEVYLASDKGTDIIKMVCQDYGGSTDRNFTVAEMQQALGDYFTFNFSFEKPKN